MVVALGPGKFYGNSLPRPRIYTDIKLNDERVDPPVPVLDPLLSWAEEAHWSMGGLSFRRVRLQGKIEGNVERLRKQKEKMVKEQRKNQSLTPILGIKRKVTVSGRSGVGRKWVEVDDSSPPAPILKKMRLRSRVVGEEGGARRKTRRLVRKLGDDFELVAPGDGKSGGGGGGDGDLVGVASRTRSRRIMVLPEQDEEEEGDDGGKSRNEGGINGGRGSISPKAVKKGNVEKGLVSPRNVSKKDGKKGSVSPQSVTRTRGSPRLKQK